MAVTALTTEEQRQIKDYIPALSDRTPGIDLAAKLVAMISDNNKIVSGKLATGSGDTQFDIDLGAAFEGKPITAQLATDEGAVYVKHIIWQGNGKARVFFSAAVTGVADLFYICDGR